MKTLGQTLRLLRECKQLYLRQVAAEIEMDTALLSKIERDERIPSKEQVLALAHFFEINPDEILELWLSEKLAIEAMGEKVGLRALKLAEERLKQHEQNK